METELYQSIIKDVTELARREAGKTGKLRFSKETATLLGADVAECAAKSPEASTAAVVPTPREPKQTAPESPPPSVVETEPLHGGLTEGGLEGIADDVRGCERCPLWRTRTNVVPGEGNPRASLVFVGEAPGASEDRLGRPFVGRAGQLLTDIIVKGMRMSREEVFICNVLKCRPPDNRTPNPEEVAQCEPYLLRQLDAIRPKVICALGAVAAQTLLKTTSPIKHLRGAWHNYHGIPFRVTYHTAYLLRNPADKRKAWEDVQEIMRLLAGEITLEL